MQKTCESCGFVFHTEDRRAKYCSRRCYQQVTGRFDAHDRVCEMCGEPYTSYDRNAKYCSQECYNQARTIQPRTCPTCGKLHTPKVDKVTYCSRSCVNRRLKQAECHYCGKVFHPRTVKKSKFCSPECYHASMASAYPRSRMNFTSKEKLIILERDGHRCVQCGSTSNLEIDHIVAVCNGGKRTIDNGQTLCVTCHDAKTVTDKAVARLRDYTCDNATAPIFSKMNH